MLRLAEDFTQSTNASYLLGIAGISTRAESKVMGETEPICLLEI